MTLFTPRPAAPTVDPKDTEAAEQVRKWAERERVPDVSLDAVDWLEGYDVKF